jgi:hypothetical protein
MVSGSNPILLSDFTGRGDSHAQFAPLDHTPEEDSTLTEAPGFSHKISLYDRYRGYISDSWWLESLSLLVATVMLLALLILFGEFHGKALSDWHSKLSLNTIIAVVTQLVQMLLLVPIASSLSQLQWLWYRNRKPLKDSAYYQEASTGLMSSLVLLYKRYASLIVWLGVIGMILQTLFGAFAQQALSLPIRQIHVGENGTRISRSLTYNTPGGSEQIGDTEPPEVVPEMKLAIFTGLLRDGVNPSEVQGSSVTGNCTFGVFASMGVCASVEDVTQSILVDFKDTEHFSGISDDNCSYTVPALRSTHPFSNVRTRSGEDAHSTLYMGAGMILPDAEMYDTSETPINDTLIEFYIIYVPDLTIVPIIDITVPPQDREKANYTAKIAALKGTLSLCAHTYNSSMQFGVTQTTLQAQETDLLWRHDTTVEGGGYVASVPRTSDTLFMNSRSMNGLSVWLITSTFNGTARMKPPPPPNANVGPGQFATLASKQVATHLYGNESGIKVADGVAALTNLLDNVAMSMSNA